MARADLIVNLARAGASGDRTLFTRTLQALIAEERRKHHTVLAAKLERYLENGTPASDPGSSFKDERVWKLLTEVTPSIRLEDLILGDSTRRILEEVVEENRRRELLQSYNLEPRHRILLVGPPGNGKTSVAHCLAEALLLPLYVVRYEGLIGSYLGETAARLGRLFQFVQSRSCVLFFDEFDTLGKERGDIHDSGEIKRVVSSLLLQIDALPSHVVTVTATNHQELLDRAVWRRFQVRVSMPSPSRSQRTEWASRFLKELEQRVRWAPRTLADKLSGMAFSELDDFAQDVRRRYVLSLPDADLNEIVVRRLEDLQGRPKGQSPTR